MSPKQYRERARKLWTEANVQLWPSLILAIVGAALCGNYGHIRHGGPGHRFVAFAGLLVFIFFATAFLGILTRTIYRVLCLHHLSVGRAASLRFVLRIIGYIAIALITLELVGISIGRLLFGGAVVGIILGVAAQQALANFFASIVLIISHPFAIGDEVTINSGSLGGKYVGTIRDIGLTHTRLKEHDGQIVRLPNATILSGAAILAEKPAPKPEP